MKDPKKIVWIASYPKSGNTWFRAFLTALYMSPKEPFDINNLITTTIASSRELFDEYAGVYSSDLFEEEVEQVRSLIYHQSAIDSDDLLFHKTHDAWTLTADGNPIFPSDVTKGVIYIIRNPLDVAISFSHHLSTSLDKTIEFMNNPLSSLYNSKDGLKCQFRQKILSWSEHVKSWTLKSPLPIMVIRYEDMLSNPIDTFSKALKFLGIPSSQEKISEAVRLSSFENLKKIEAKTGFQEKSAKSSCFFRNGIAGEWKYVLKDVQIKKLISNHLEVMNIYGYLP